MHKDTLSQFGKYFEEKFVAALITEEKFAERVYDGFDSKFIECDYLRELVEKIFGYYQKYKTFPTLETVGYVVTDEVTNKDHKALISDFLLSCNVKDKAELEYIKDKSVEFMRNRAIRSAIYDSVDLIKEELYEEIPKKIENALRLFTGNDIGINFFGDIDDRSKFPNRYCISTGWEPLDKKLGSNSFDGIGGLGKGELGVIISPAGLGKTSTLVSIGSAAIKQKKTVVHYTLEIHDKDLGVMYDSCLTGFSRDSIAANREDVNRRLKQYLGSTLIIKEYPTRAASVRTIENHLELLRRNRIYPDLVIIDYADLLKIKRTDFRHKDLEDNYEELRRIAGEWGLPIWTASQAGRVALNAQVVNVEHIAESYGKACVADVILTLARTREDKIKNTGRFHLAKNRFGPDGIVYPAKINLASVDIELFDYDENDCDASKNIQENTTENIRQLFNQYAVKNLNKQSMDEEEKGN